LPGLLFCAATLRQIGSILKDRMLGFDVHVSLRLWQT
jgi:hypothetical protein